MARSSAGKSGSGEVKLTAKMRFVVLHGDDRMRQDLALEGLRKALAAEHGEDGFDTIRYDAAAPASLSPGGGASGGLAAEILDECRTFGLIARYKLVIVENADVLLRGGDEEDDEGGKGPSRGIVKNKSNRALMEAYAADPSEAATLVLRASTWRPGKLDKAIDALGAAGAIARCDSPTPLEAAKFAQARCQEVHGVAIAPEAAALLVGNLGTDMGRIDTELAKLAMVNPGKPITRDVVERFVGFSREEDFWRIQESLLSGSSEGALRHLRDMIEVSRHAPVALAWSYTDLARKVHGASLGLAAGENPGSIASRLRLWGASKELILKAARRVTPERAAALLRAAVENDVRLKTSQGDPVVNLEALTIRFTRTLA